MRINYTSAWSRAWKGALLNKTITDGIVITPAKFAFGLHHWSSQDGPPGQDDYDNEPNAAFVPADQDFSGCLEPTKTQTVQKLRAFYQTPLSPGCYRRIRTRMKLVSGAFPTVSIAGWPGAAGNVHLTGVRMKLGRLPPSKPTVRWSSSRPLSDQATAPVWICIGAKIPFMDILASISQARAAALCALRILLLKTSAVLSSIN